MSWKSQAKRCKALRSKRKAHTSGLTCLTLATPPRAWVGSFMAVVTWSSSSPDHDRGRRRGGLLALALSALPFLRGNFTSVFGLFLSSAVQRSRFVTGESVNSNN